MGTIVGPYLESNRCPAKARLIFTAKRERDYQDGLARQIMNHHTEIENNHG